MKKLILVFLSALGLIACEQKNGDLYTLYRDSPLDTSMRIHIATFNSLEGGSSVKDYNKENCQIAAELFKSQPGVLAKYWCEKGTYKK